MPQDRIVTVNVTAMGDRDEHGDFVPGPVTAHRVWVSKRDDDAERVIETGGMRSERQRRWRMRWIGSVYTSALSLLQVVDNGRIFNVINVVEVVNQRNAPDLRRRFIDLTGVEVITP